MFTTTDTSQSAETPDTPAVEKTTPFSELSAKHTAQLEELQTDLEAVTASEVEVVNEKPPLGGTTCKTINKYFNNLLS